MATYRLAGLASFAILLLLAVAVVAADEEFADNDDGGPGNFTGDGEFETPSTDDAPPEVQAYSYVSLQNLSNNQCHL